MRLDATRDLIEEVKRSSDVRSTPASSTFGGTNQGAYVCKELVYAYAIWISPKFHLNAIRAIPDSETFKTPEGWPGPEQTRLITPFLQISALSTCVPDASSHQGWLPP